MHNKKRKILPTLVIIMLVIAVLTNIFVLGPIVVISRADPGDITDSWYNATQLNVTVLQLEPRINWYDFQFNNSGTWESKLNAQIDVDASYEYRFIVNVSSDQNWTDIEYINITAWADLGDDSGYNFNNTEGGNINLFLQYENKTGNANWTLMWPDDEASSVSIDSNETIEYDPDGSPGNTDCYNVTFAFIPSYQFRYAQDPTNTTAGYNDPWSWNFNITIFDSEGYYSYHNPRVNETVDEFGVFSYSEIISAGWPTLVGNPGFVASVNDAGGSGNISISTRSNGNYSLSADVDTLTHTVNPSYTMANTTIQTRGGDLGSLTSFPGNGVQYYFGGASSYRWAYNDTTSFATSDVEWAVDIPIAQAPGDYEATIYYHLKTETN